MCYTHWQNSDLSAVLGGCVRSVPRTKNSRRMAEMKHREGEDGLDKADFADDEEDEDDESLARPKK